MAEASGESSMANTVSPTPEPQGFEPEGKEPQGKEPTPGVGPTPTFQRSQTQAESKQFYESLQHVRFQSLDDDAYYLKAEQYLSRHDATNFIVDYGSDVAYATWDLKLDRNVLGPNGKMKLTRESKHRLLDLERVRPPKILTRWIAIFNASDQVDLVHTLIEKYDLSPRHQKLLVSPPPIPHNYRPTERDLAAAKASAEKGRKGVKGGYLEIPNRVYHWHAVEMGGKCKFTSFICAEHCTNNSKTLQLAIIRYSVHLKRNEEVNTIRVFMRRTDKPRNHCSSKTTCHPLILMESDFGLG